MKRFKVYYTVTTTSTYGAYAYHNKKIVDAETEKDAKEIIKNQSQGFKRYKLTFRNVVEI
jgi:hypothetical protein